ncbi:hypothetical protein FRUB_06795 [Fimbriiglobus ruber]|uniref:Uncharacterized protein n=1 Tax=Fimbriiglobus ruber TaxID=1908690 RepID=A0A225DMN0_9BACT|nr:hypothetical protein FRUB_06795 [Fimbriiglobus ruber]
MTESPKPAARRFRWHALGSANGRCDRNRHVFPPFPGRTDRTPTPGRPHGETLTWGRPMCASRQWLNAWRGSAFTPAETVGKGLAANNVVRGDEITGREPGTVAETGHRLRLRQARHVVSGEVQHADRANGKDLIERPTEGEVRQGVRSDGFRLLLLAGAARVLFLVLGFSRRRCLLVLFAVRATTVNFDRSRERGADGGYRVGCSGCAQYTAAICRRTDDQYESQVVGDRHPQHSHPSQNQICL